jgi:hypothetical protein
MALLGARTSHGEPQELRAQRVVLPWRAQLAGRIPRAKRDSCDRRELLCFPRAKRGKFLGVGTQGSRPEALPCPIACGEMLKKGRKTHFRHPKGCCQASRRAENGPPGRKAGTWAGFWGCFGAGAWVGAVPYSVTSGVETRLGGRLGRKKRPPEAIRRPWGLCWWLVSGWAGGCRRRRLCFGRRRSKGCRRR